MLFFIVVSCNGVQLIREMSIYTRYLYTEQTRPEADIPQEADSLADAILDKIVHDSYTFEIRGADEHTQKSMREVYGVGSK